MKRNAAHAAFIDKVSIDFAATPPRNHSARGWFSSGVCGLQLRFEMARCPNSATGDATLDRLNTTEFMLPGYFVAEIAMLPIDDADASRDTEMLTFLALLIED